MSRPRTSPDPTRSVPGAPETPGRDGGRSRTEIGDAVRRVFAPRLASRSGNRIWQRWQRTLRLLRPLGAVSYGNALRLLDSGDEAFETMWGAIAEARVSVLDYT
jgi:phosphatidylserine/phosphatidylglycerophosphate/cardiolipin synthase-like enzyme